METAIIPELDLRVGHDPSSLRFPRPQLDKPNGGIMEYFEVYVTRTDIHTHESTTSALQRLAPFPKTGLGWQVGEVGGLGATNSYRAPLL